MNYNNSYASIEEIKDAIEIVMQAQNERQTVINHNILNDIISAAALACIDTTDTVLVAAVDADIIASIISYIYYPKVLSIYNLALITKYCDNTSYIMENINNINTLLISYCHSRQVLITNGQNDELFMKKQYDTLIVGYLDYNYISANEPVDRFGLDIGHDYDTFVMLLTKAVSVLKKDGVLIALCKPVWMLKAWNIIHKLGLQLEYRYYKLYESNKRHRNVRLWLRFSKKTENFDVNEQKISMQALMTDNGIDRLFAHRNNLTYPYIELCNTNTEAYIDVEQRLQNMQYFFTLETTKKLSDLCQGYTACLVTPSVALYAHEANKNVVLFEMDNRFRQNKGVKFIKYNLNTGLTKLMQNKYRHKFDTLICDPPFDITLTNLAEDIDELMKKDKNSVVYVVYPAGRKASLLSAMKCKDFVFVNDSSSNIIEYAYPPKLVRIHGKDAIQLFKFKYK